MRITDEKGRIFGKINIVDLGIILLLILSIAAVGVKVYRDKFTEREHTAVRYTLFVAGVRQQSVDAINMVHERITDAETDDPLGDIVEIKKEPAANIFQKADGEYVKSYYPEKYDLYITIETDGVVTPDGYFTEGGKKLLYGDTIGINNGYSQMFGYVEGSEVVK